MVEASHHRTIHEGVSSFSDKGRIYYRSLENKERYEEEQHFGTHKAHDTYGRVHSDLRPLSAFFVFSRRREGLERRRALLLPPIEDRPRERRHARGAWMRASPPRRGRPCAPWWPAATVCGGKGGGREQSSKEKSRSTDRRENHVAPAGTRVVCLRVVATRVHAFPYPESPQPQRTGEMIRRKRPLNAHGARASPSTPTPTPALRDRN